MTVRVVSLVPSVTETLLALGVEPVACTRFCEQPALRHVGGTKDPDIAAIIALRPDLVVVDDEENRREDADALIAAGLRLHVTSVHAVDDVAPTVAALAEATHAPHLPNWVRKGVLTHSFSVPERSIRAFVPIWRRPWMALGGDTYGSSVLEAIGVVNVCAGHAGGRYPSVALDAAAALAPDVVLAPSEPYPFSERHVAELERVAPVVLVDGKDLFWWGTRTPEALTRLAAVLAAAP